MIEATMRDIYLFNNGLGSRRIIGAIEYFRCLEGPLASNNLKLERGHTLLDIGSSNTIFPPFMASKGVQVWATDIDDSVLKLGGVVEKLEISNFHAEIQDARSLPYPGNCFDRISAISTLEHIPNDGDSIAVKEMSRVLKKGGVMVITVPYGSFEEERQQHVSYFQRVYSEEDIHKRLIEPSGLEVERIEYFGETKYNFTKYWNKIPSLLKIPFLWAQPIFSKLFLGFIKDTNNLSRVEKNVFMKTGGVCLTFKKR
ncbi:MAG: methyltransferase domain-containing protein [Thermotogota bacterium]|nr:methyltransferase domain-containing protein [Thermotogota bacterium]